MRCSQVEDLLAPYVDGGLSPEQRASLEGHLDTCSACRQAAEVTRLARQALRALPPVRPPASFAPRIRAAVRQQVARASSQPLATFNVRALLPSAALALMAACVLGWCWTGSERSYIAPFAALKARSEAARSPRALAADEDAVRAPGPMAPRIAMRPAFGTSPGITLTGRNLGSSRDLKALVAAASMVALAPKRSLAAEMTPRPAVAASHVTARPESATDIRVPDSAEESESAPAVVSVALASPEVMLASAPLPAATGPEASVGPAPAPESAGRTVSLRTLTSDQALDWPPM
jgi:Putative zinc-finger